MITQIIGWYCITHVIIGEMVLLISIIQKDNLPDGARARVNFMNIGYIAVAAWCFK